jgi:hypothetical protein
VEQEGLPPAGWSPMHPSPREPSLRPVGRPSSVLPFLPQPVHVAAACRPVVIIRCREREELSALARGRMP